MPNLESKIREVVVYADRAIVTRRAAFNAEKGVSVVEFGNLPSVMDPSSVQLSGAAGIVLRDVATRDVFVDEVPVEERARLNAELLALRDEARVLDDNTKRIAGERAFVERIAERLTGDQGKPAPAEFLPEHWIHMVEFYRERLSALDAELRETSKAKRQLDARISAAENRLAAAGGEGERRSVSVSVTIECSEAVEAELFLTYAVWGPSWRPVYDLRVSTETKMVQVVYNALVSQSTGEDWQDARLRLSTAQVHVSGVPPEVLPWYIGIRSPEAPRKRSASADFAKSMPAPAAAAPEMMEEAYFEKKEMALMEVEDAGVSGGASSVEFAIGGSASIPGDGEPHRVGVTIMDLPGTFSYFAVPVLEKHAYLTAKAKNDRDFPFLPGLSRIYLDGAFVAEAELDLVLPGEEFETSLGTDEGVSVDYKTVRTFDAKAGVVGKRVKALSDYRIVLKNRKKTDVSISVKDRLPIPTNQQITVKLEEPEYRKDTEVLKKDETGIFTWTLSLKPGQELELPFKYTIEYPQGARLSGV